jgi:hypothetical protein
MPSSSVRSWFQGFAGFVGVALVVGFAYTQAPLYYSNQNQYFLHGLAEAGRGRLAMDWLATTADPTPVFSALVTATVLGLPDAVFHAYYFILFGVYGVSMLGLFSFLAGEDDSPRLKLAFAAALLLLHSALIRWGSYRLLGWDYPWYFQSGLAGQYTLGAVFQPSAFGVFLILSVVVFVRGHEFGAVLSAVLAATVHPTYALTAGLLTLSYLIVIWRDGRRRQALKVGALAFVLILPTLIHGVMTFRPTSAAAFAEAQGLLVHLRIPHHCIARLWCDGVAVGQIAWMLLGVALARRTRLAFVMGAVFLISALLTIAQVALDSDSLALLFPWRASAILVPLATAVIVARLVLVGRGWFARTPMMFANLVVVGGLVLAGVALSGFRQGYQTNDAELPLLDFVKANAAADDVYLLPVKTPNLAARTCGSLSSDFKPLAVKKADETIIPIDFQRFRLLAQAPLFVDFKAIPYRDVDVLEWRRRLAWADEIFQKSDWSGAEFLAKLSREGITHVVVPANRDLQNEGLKLHYRDDSYKIYRRAHP